MRLVDDEFLGPFATLVECLGDLEVVVDPVTGDGMRVERAVLDLPIELDVGVDDDGVVVLATAPPTQHVETTIMPVFHQVRIEIGVDGSH
jgi:hypothetical protein